MLTWEGIGRCPSEGHVPSMAHGLGGPTVATLMACSRAVSQGVKAGGEKPRGARTADKAGWIKKSSGGLLGLWKDRYLLLCQAQLLVYENEVRPCLALRLDVLGQGHSQGSPLQQGEAPNGGGKTRSIFAVLCNLGEHLPFPGSLWLGPLPVGAGLGLLDEGPFEVYAHKGVSLLTSTLQLPGPGLVSMCVNIPEN